MLEMLEMLTIWNKNIQFKETQKEKFENKGEKTGWTLAGCLLYTAGEESRWAATNMGHVCWFGRVETLYSAPVRSTLDDVGVRKLPSTELKASK
jgi:hypothetical protein